MLSLSRLFPEPITAVLFLSGIGVHAAVSVIWRGRYLKFWEQQPAQLWASPIVQLPLTVDANPAERRMRRSLGLFALLLAWVPTVLLVISLFGTPAKPLSAWINAGVAAFALSGWLIAFVCLRKKHGRVTLSEGLFSIGDHQIALTSQTTCTFAKRHFLLPGPLGLPSAAIEIRSGDEAITFRPMSCYSANASVSGYGNGSQLIQALAARCHGGNAKAWLMTAFPILPTVDSGEKSARLHPVVKIALGLLGLLALLLTALMVSLGLK